MIQRDKDIIARGIMFCIAIIVSAISVYAETIYAGESKTFNLTETPNYCEFSGNTYNLDGINYTINENQVTVTIAPNFKSDNLTFTCFVGKDKPVHYSFGGGGSSSTTTITTTTTENKTDEVIDETNDTIDDEIVISDKEEKWYNAIDPLIIYIILGTVLIIIVVSLIIGYKKNKNLKPKSI